MVGMKDNSDSTDDEYQVFKVTATVGGRRIEPESPFRYEAAAESFAELLEAFGAKDVVVYPYRDPDYVQRRERQIARYGEEQVA